MAEKWMTDGYGVKALVGGDAVDEWKPRGWSEADEPSGSDLVWMRHTETGGQQKFAAGALEQWKALGWEPSEPEPPYDVTKDPQLVDVEARAAAQSPAKTRTAGRRRAETEES